MEASQNAYNLIRQSETLRLQAYPDPGPAGTEIPTIGWGRTYNVKMGDTCSEGQANDWLMEDVERFVMILNHNFPEGLLNQNQFDALVDFIYNEGPGAPTVKDGLIWLKEKSITGQPVHSTLMRKILARDFLGASDEFPKWTKSGGVVMGGLVTRRELERDLFLT